MRDISPQSRWPPLAWFTPAAALFVVADQADQHIGNSVLLGAPLDETAHVLTALLVIWALGGVADRFLLPALVTSVAVDLDHLPRDLGQTWLTAGTPRPYTHSLLTIAVVLSVAALAKSRRESAIGVALGLVVHFWRDLAEPGTGVALLWPLSSASISLPHASYLGVMAVAIAAGLVRAVRYRPNEAVREGHQEPDHASARSAASILRRDC